MKKIMFLLALFTFVGVQVFAQKTVTGTVTNADDGAAMPGVNVSVKGTTTGTMTGDNGAYSINVPEGDQTLVFSFIGMQTQEVTVTGEVANCVMQTEESVLEDVVVTALGITREKKAIGYSAQDVSGDDLTKGRSSNVMNALSGRVAGMSISSASGNMGGSNRVTIRGVNSISGNNQPLYVIDGVPIDNSDYNTTDAARGAGGYDYGNMSQDINSDDVESITVLKGPSAAALYGSRAANGVIVVTTKKGKNSATKTLGISVNSSVTFEQVAILPKYQNQYGGGVMLGGTDGFDQVDINGTTYNIIDYGTDESWGPKYNPNTQYLASWDLFDWEANGMQGNPTTSAWVAPNKDVKDFFNTGVTYSNNVGITGGSEKATYRLSYTNMDLSGYMPNSSLKRNTINYNGSYKFTDKLEAFSTINYINNKAKGRPSTGYDDNNVMQKFNQWGQRQLDMGKLSNYVNPDGTQRVWNRNGWDDPTPAYSDNPYWTRNKNYQNDERNRFYGNLGVSYKLTDFLKVQGKINTDYYTFRERERVAIGSQAQSQYTEAVREFFETNSEFLFMFNKSFNKINLSANFGGNQLKRKFFRNTSGTSGGMVVDDLWNVNNSVASATTSTFQSRKAINSLYGSATVDYKRILFLEATLRNDWSSTLPKGKNSYLYPSTTVSFVFSELGALKSNGILSFGKIRGGWAQVGNDTDPYTTQETYLWTNNFGSAPMYSVPTTLNNKNLKSETTSSFEFGTELKFLKNRVGLDFTYYSNRTFDQIIPVAVSGSTGYGFEVINAGEMTNKGIELMLSAAPIKTKNFEWNISINYAKSKNQVVELVDGVDVYQLASGPFSVTINAKKGEEYGVIMGTDYVYDANGNKVVGSDGSYLSSAVKSLGSVMPKYTMGISNSFRVFGVEVSGLIDIRKGGKFFSTTYMWGNYSGILEESAAMNENGLNVREDPADGGGVLLNAVYGSVNADGSVQWLDADGNVSATPVTNTSRLDAETWGGHLYDGPGMQNVFDASYVKLRELRIGYTIPQKYTGPIHGLSLGVYGRNLATWGTSIKHVDPENTTSSGNIQGIEGGALPSIRNYGVNLSFNF